MDLVSGPTIVLVDREKGDLTGVLSFIRMAHVMHSPIFLVRLMCHVPFVCI